MIDMLLNLGADPNIKENEEIGWNTPMHRAVEKNMMEVIDLFFQCGGDPTM